MKMSKKLVSMMLAVVMLFTLTAPALAADNRETVDSGEVVFNMPDGSAVTLRYKDFENGDCEFYMFEDGILTASSYIERATNKITRIDYEPTGTKKTVQFVEPVQEKAFPVPAAAGYIDDGRIGYNHYVQGTLMTVNYIDVSHKVSTKTSSFDANGKYKDILTMVNVIVGALLIPGALAASTAKTILEIYDLASENIEVPTCKVESLKTTVTWKGEVGEKTAYVEGARHVCTVAGKENLTDEEGSYYPVTSYKDHNKNLANQLYPLLFRGYDRFEVVSWS